MEPTDTRGRTAPSFAEITGIRPTFEQLVIGQLYVREYISFTGLRSYVPSLSQEETMYRLNALVGEGRISVQPSFTDSASEPAYALSSGERTRMGSLIAEMIDDQSGF